MSNVETRPLLRECGDTTPIARKRGLQEAYKCEECEFIWLLDDNQPQKNSLKVLKEFWDALKEDKKKEKVFFTFKQTR